MYVMREWGVIFIHRCICAGLGVLVGISAREVTSQGA